MDKFKALIRTLADNLNETGERLNQDTQAVARQGWKGAPPEVKERMMGRGMMAAGATSGPAKSANLLRPQDAGLIRRLDLLRRSGSAPSMNDVDEVAKIYEASVPVKGRDASIPQTFNEMLDELTTYLPRVRQAVGDIPKIDILNKR